MTTKLPGFPPVPSNLGPDATAYLKALGEALEVRLGRRGDPRDRAITLRELIDSGMATQLGHVPFNPNNLGPQTDFESSIAPDLSQPPAPTSLTASAAFQTVLLEWSNGNLQFRTFAFTEVYRSTTDVIGDAVLVAVVRGNKHADQVDSNSTFYYWVRHVSTSEIRGPFNATSGVIATTADINAADIADQAVTNAKLAVDAVQGAVIAASAITTTKIEDNAISTAKIAANAVTANEIAANAVTANEIAANSVTSSELVAGTITASSGILANAAVVNATIANAAVDNAKIASLDAAKINTGQLNANRIKVDGASIVANSSGQLEVDELNANVITSGQINASNIDVVNLDAGDITSGTLTSDRINVTDLLLPTGGGTISGTTLGGFVVGSSGQQQFKYAMPIGVGAGIYFGYIRFVGGTNHIKSVYAFFTTSSTATPNSTNTIYSTPRTDTLAGHILRFYSNSDSTNIPITFSSTVHTGTVYFWVLGNGDSGTDTFTSVEARFHRFGTGTTYSFGSYSSYQYTSFSSNLTHARTGGGANFYIWNGVQKTPVAGGDFGSSILCSDGYQYERGPFQTASSPFPTYNFYSIRRRTWSQA